MNSPRTLPAPIVPGAPLTALAPMQAITDLAFMRVVADYGAPDYFFTEYFRVHSAGRLDKDVLASITANDTGRPVFAQLIGEEPKLLAKAARELLAHGAAGIDLNMGCPAPKIYKKSVGGGLLREPRKIDQVLGALRDAIPGLFTVKTRLGFDSTHDFVEILELVNKHSVDLLSVHGRTVQEKYFGEVHYDVIAQAVREVRCPVLANGNITSASAAERVLHRTGARGVMLGRHAIRNPWIFSQCRDKFAGNPVRDITHADVREYIERLYHATKRVDADELGHVAKMKRYLNFIGTSIDANGAFLHAMRRTRTEAELFSSCDRYLLAEPAHPYSVEPFPGVLARPKCERTVAAQCAEQ